jgi:hypothetical protein
LSALNADMLELLGKFVGKYSVGRLIVGSPFFCFEVETSRLIRTWAIPAKK